VYNITQPKMLLYLSKCYLTFHNHTVQLKGFIYNRHFHLRSNLLSRKDLWNDVAGRVVESELRRSEGDLGGGAVVAAVHDGHGGWIVSLERRHDWANENVDSAILEKQLFLILFTRTCNMLDLLYSCSSIKCIWVLS